MNLEELVSQKSNCLLDLQMARAEKNRRRTFELASWAAALETKIASHYVSVGDIENAVVSLNSAGSCLVIAQRHSEANRIFESAKEITKDHGISLAFSFTDKNG